MILGVDYYPEHWENEEIERDFARMKTMGVNTIRIGEFAWHMLEKEEGQFDFSYWDDVLDKAENAGLDVIFGTPTATFPAWLSRRYPEVHSEDIHGHTRVFGGRRQYCFNSDKYRELSIRLVKKLVSHYSNRKSIIAWQADNEFGHEGSDMCWCAKCESAFRKFLEKKYGNIDSLNKEYGTIFWGQTYNSFDEIVLPKETITVHNPSLLLDHFRFRSNSVEEFARLQLNAIRECKGELQFVTHNFSGGFFEKAFDFGKIADQLDIVSYDNYPVWGGLKEPVSPAHTAMAHDFMRCLKDRSFLIVEQLMGAQGHDIIGYLPRPLQSAMWSWQALSRGCSGMLFFRWRAMDRGQEQFCLGIIDHNDREGRKFEEAKGVFEKASGIGAGFESSMRSEVAVVYDYDNIWSWRIQRASALFDFTTEMIRLYRPFHRMNASTDVIPANRDFGGYKVVAVPVMQVMDENLSERLKKFASQGGTVIFSYRAGIKKRNNNVHRGIASPGLISDLAGISILESESLQQGQDARLIGTDGSAGSCSVWRDMVDAVNAEVLYRYDDPFFKDKACITVNRYGKGLVYYVGGGADDMTMDTLANIIAKASGLTTLNSPEGLELVKRTMEGEDHLFYMNHTGKAVTYEGEEIGPYASGEFQSVLNPAKYMD
ncbi:MAG: beta-galactosidase [Youngiibacter sp.]|nr:beta-galactosidase [Youngiibacter sp.]